VKILVTGHHGYIGSVTVGVLREHGHDVHGLDTFYYEGCDLAVDATEVSCVRSDVREPGRPDLGDYDAIVHLAALSNDPIGELRPELTLDINFRASLALARAAKEAGVGRFVFASSCSMYGAGANGEAVDEEAPLRPLSAYAESKVRSEEALGELADRDFSPIFMRNSTAYGVSPRLRLDVVLNNLAAWAHTTGRIRILSDGTPWRPLVHVRDIAAATAAVLDAPRDVVHRHAFNIGAPAENYQVRDVATIVSEESGCDVEYAGSGDPDARSYRVDFGKFARAFPDLKFEWTVRDGARELLDVFSRLGLTLADFEGDRFIRLRRIQTLLDRGALDDDLRWRTL
jgi:nucleoside-diphosphate-sugar epimerase